MEPGTADIKEGFSRVYSCFIQEGLVPSLSSSAEAILLDCKQQLAHLHPNGLLMLSIFQRLYKVYVGIHPNVAMFFHYLYPHVESPELVTGRVTFFRV
ncbi:hypothetical protein QYE76_070743 [Lolium multiflorum]|uniref:Transposase (putative) gypsy type domain-containing protein n=1 Tax=Lolium multiflorum TaxID=4521 RepID=A0AAD8WE73_LOLMU|nr:hypothetical protein QYE76_070743 [Lolium multiflorum]